MGSSAHYREEECAIRVCHYACGSPFSDLICDDVCPQAFPGETGYPGATDLLFDAANSFAAEAEASSSRFRSTDGSLDPPNVMKKNGISSEISLHH